jgi:hypothetical protein
MRTVIKKAAEALIAVTALFGVVLMFVVFAKGRSGADLVKTAANFFFYFTILSNIMVVILFAGKLFFGKGKAAGFFSNPVLQGAVTVYITVTGLIFFFLLRTVFKSTGPDFDIANSVLHNVIPAAVFLYWLLFMRKSDYRVVHVLYWLIFPLFYLVITLVRGAFLQWYPYPFVDVAKYGYPQVFLTSAVMTVFFAAIGLVLVGLSKIGKRKAS